MGLRADGWKKTLISIGNRGKARHEMTKEDYPREVAVTEDANITLYQLCYYTETLHDLELKICDRLQKWLYDPVTHNRNNVTYIEWVFDYDPPVIKQLVQRERAKSSNGYSNTEVADMWITGEAERMFDHVHSRNQEIHLDKVVHTRPLFPMLVKYVCDFLKNRLTHDLILKPGERSFTIHVCSAVSTVHMMVEPYPNCPADQQTPLTSVKELNGKCKPQTVRYSFNRDPLFRISYCFSSPRKGEAEVKLVSSCQRYLVQSDIKDFLVACKDTDVLPLFLLNHKLMLPDCQVHILLDEGTTKYRKEELVVSVQGLAADIESFFREHVPNVHNPVVFMCCWMVLTGTDFVENISGMDAISFWSFVRKHVKRLMDQFEGQQPFFDDQGVTVFSEHLIYQMIIAFHSNYPESSQGKQEFQAKLKKYPPRTIEELHELTIDKGKKRWIKDSTEKVMSKIRRSSYNVHYWERAARMEPTLDPLTIVNVNGYRVPLFGYCMDHNNEVQMSDVVAPT